MHHQPSSAPFLLPSKQLSAQTKANPLSRAALYRASQPRRAQSQRLPIQPGFLLAPDSDSGLLGDAKTTAATANLIGVTSPNISVALQNSALTTRSDATGKFLFSEVPLELGNNQLTVIAGANAGKQRSFTATIERTTTDPGDAVLQWNATVLRTIQRDQAGGLETARTLAIAHAAILDVVNALSGGNTSYQPLPVPVPSTASIAAAVAGAAHQVLTQLYPDQKPSLDTALTASLTALADAETAESAGVAFGQAVADGILTERSQDGALLTQTYQPKIKPGKWRPTPPNFLPAAAVAWRQITPFVLNQADQFRPQTPPKLTNARYTQDFNQVKRLGQIDSQERTETQTQIARFWIGNAGTLTLPGMWNEVAAQASAMTERTLLENAQLFAALNLSLVDASIAAWDAKYTYRSWRPITAIRLAGSDQNPETEADKNWQSFLETPAHPDYVSSHSTFSGAAATILTQTFGKRRLSVTSFDFPGVQRSFKDFKQAAAEAGISRIYGGIHTMSANQAGLKLGQKVGSYVFKHYFS